MLCPEHLIGSLDVVRRCSLYGLSSLSYKLLPRRSACAPQARRHGCQCLGNASYGICLVSTQQHRRQIFRGTTRLASRHCNSGRRQPEKSLTSRAEERPPHYRNSSLSVVHGSGSTLPKEPILLARAPPASKSCSRGSGAKAAPVYAKWKGSSLSPW